MSWSEEVSAEDEGHQHIEFKASGGAEITREWVSIEKQPEDQALQL